MICKKRDPSSVYRTGFIEQVDFGFESGFSVKMFTAICLTIKGYLELPGWQSYLD